jgi:hypothetical protein
MANPGLTAEQLAAIKAGLAPQYSATGGGEAGSSTYIPSQYTLGGQNYLGNGQGGYWGFQDNPQWDSGSSIANYNGTPYTSYDAQGNQIGNGQLSGIQNDSFMSKWGPFAMVGAGMGASLLAGAGAVGGSGAFVGEGAQSGIPAWDAAGSGMAGSGGVGGAGGVGTIAGGSGAGFSPGASGGAFNSAIGGGSVVDPSAGMFAPAASNAAFTKALADAAVPSWLKVGAGLLGAVAGSQPVQKSTTENVAKDPRVAPYLFGDGTGSNPGLLGYAAQQLARDQSPQNQARVQQMKNVGAGLLSAPVAGNGFGLFTKGRY